MRDQPTKFSITHDLRQTNRFRRRKPGQFFPRELGIRVALGATRLSIVRHVVAQGAMLAVVGLVIGIVASLALAKAAASMVFEIGVIDPVTLAFAPLVLLGAALLGCYLPARRAARVDPIISMRSE